MRRSISALLDTNVQLSRFTHVWAYTRRTEYSNNRVTTWIEEKPVLRLLRNMTPKQCIAIYESLNKIAALARAGDVELYDSDETLAEFLKFRPAGFGLRKFDVFDGVTIKHARAPIARVFKIDSTYTRKGARESWHAFLAQITNGRFLTLLKHTGGAHAADLYHVWEAEHNGLDAFITLDVRFVNAVMKPKPLNSPVRVVTPSKFVEWSRRAAVQIS